MSIATAPTAYTQYRSLTDALPEDFQVGSITGAPVRLNPPRNQTGLVRTAVRPSGTVTDQFIIQFEMPVRQTNLWGAYDLVSRQDSQVVVMQIKTLNSNEVEVLAAPEREREMFVKMPPLRVRRVVGRVVSRSQAVPNPIHPRTGN